jgi:hypothetical protein
MSQAHFPVLSPLHRPGPHLHKACEDNRKSRGDDEGKALKGCGEAGESDSGGWLVCGLQRALEVVGRAAESFEKSVSAKCMLWL